MYEFLLQAGVVSAGDLARAADAAAQLRTRVPASLVSLGLIDESRLARTLADACNLEMLAPAVDVAFECPDLSLSYCRQRHIAPVGTAGERLIVAMADPTDSEALEGLRFAAQQDCMPVVATFSAIAAMLGQDGGDPRGRGAVSNDSQGQRDDLVRIADQSSDAPAIRLVNDLIERAVVRGASDIHIEPNPQGVRIRLRIDGVLIEAEELASRWSTTLASRIKVMAKLDIAEKRLPQDRRFSFAVKGHPFDVRVATLPTSFGEDVVLRLLMGSTQAGGLEALGLPAAALTIFSEIIGRPNGLVLLTGPTGSGKTTTLYAALMALNRPGNKILTVEDPVEYRISGVNQVQVLPDAGLTYATALRSFLRHDPDVIMVGEIRDLETAEIALRASLTGHLVLSTLHTNTALGAFTRLLDLGVESYLLATAISAVGAQRLVRRLCPACRQAHPLSDAARELFASQEMAAPDVLFAPVGCEECRTTGYAGRLPVIDIVPMSPELSELVRRGAAEAEMREASREKGLLTHALQHAAKGETAIDEIARVIGAGAC